MAEQVNGGLPVCPVNKKCGGCQLLGTEYSEQLKNKRKTVAGLMSGICSVDPVVGMDNPLHYRNKVNAAFDIDRHGKHISGVYKAGTHEVVNVESCLIENEKADAIIGTIRGMLKSFKIKTYDEDTGYGLIRHVMVRVAHATGQIMVVLVLSDPILPAKNNFVKALRSAHPEITTVVLNVNNKKTSMVLGNRNITLYGPGFITDELCGKKFRISPSSFYQVNSEQTEKLYKRAISLAKLSGKETVIDAYCGIGTIGLVASDKAKNVIGVELNGDAVRDANTNKKANNTTNISFYNADAGEFMERLAAEGEHVDVVFMDPPRSGSTEQFMDSVAVLRPDRVVYISCNPETLARDIKYFRTIGYKAKTVTPFDMFPYTEEIECVASLTNMMGKKALATVDDDEE
ncbi:MAG: 23S rRNA (uracil(1939)-C(5))-methyltransferase RlmD [Lachnospiraceae bacterium]|nr:23S rRNA (uracil(1939)-C(5))-methyltransferase RlmD [Lachnospiraceae bacterium]